MSFTVVGYEGTPNPNAVKCWLDRPISDVPRSFLNRTMAEDDPIARALFDEAGVTNILMNGRWMSISRRPDEDWPAVKERVESVLARVEAPKDREQ